MIGEIYTKYEIKCVQQTQNDSESESISHRTSPCQMLPKAPYH